MSSNFKLLVIYRIEYIIELLYYIIIGIILYNRILEMIARSCFR